MAFKVDTANKNLKKLTKEAKNQVEKLNQTFNPPFASKKNSRSKTIVKVATIALTAGAAVVTPAVVVYKKNEKYEISIESEAIGFDAYTLEIKSGTTISTLKNKLNVFEGHNLVGIYKDPECTIPYKNTDKVKKDTKVYLKYEKKTYMISMPENSKYFNVTYDTTENLSSIEWGNFSFVVKLNSAYHEVYDLMDLRVLVNGQEISPEQTWDENKEITYSIFVEENMKIDIELLRTEKISLNSIPSNVIIKNEEGLVITDEVYAGEKITLHYEESAGKVMSVFELDGEPIQQDHSMFITEEMEITYSEVESCGLSFKEYGTYMEVSEYDGSVADVVIPSKVHNKPVTGVEEIIYDTIYSEIGDIEGVQIKSGAFAKNGSKVKSLYIPGTIQTITNWASYYVCCESDSSCLFTNLKTLTIGEGVKNINYEAFAYCESLEEIYIPSSIEKMEYSTFWDNNPSLKKVVVDSQKIFDMLNILDYNSNYGIKDFQREIWVLKTVVDNSGGATGVLFTEDIQRFEFGNYYAFIKSSYLDGAEYTQITSYNNAKYLGTVSNPYYTLYEVEDKSIESFQIASITKKIGNYAFSSCENLTSIEIPNGVTTIGENAFLNCKNLKSVQIPDSVTSILSNAFASCAIKSISLPSGLTSISSRTFYGNKIESIVLPESIISIGSNAFYNNNLKQITLPSGITTIESYAFYGNDLKEITIPNSVNSIGIFAFERCDYLKKVTIESSTIYKDLTSLTSCGYLINNAIEIKVPKSIVNYYNSSFLESNSCLKFESGDYYIFVPSSKVNSTVEYTQMISYNNITYLSTADNPYHTILYVEDITVSTIEIAEGVMTIASYAFAYCNNLTSIVLPQTITQINNNAFTNCSKLRTINIPTGVKTLNSQTFGTCISLKDVTIESSDIYNKLTSVSSCGNLIYYASNIKVLKNIVDNDNNANTYLNDVTKFTKTEDGNYYVYSKK